jgi:hypothetical protein
MNKNTPKLLAGLVLIAAAMAGVYAVAATAATSIATAFSTEEATSHAQNAEFAARLKQDSASHREARAKCAVLARAKKNICNAEVDARRGLKRSGLL